LTTLTPLRQTILPPSRTLVPARGQGAAVAVVTALARISAAAGGSGGSPAPYRAGTDKVTRGLLVDVVV
jgi:hypothetical protein